MKKIFAILLTAALCLSLTACAAGTPESPDEPDPAPAAPTAPVETAPVSQPVPAEEPEPETIWMIPEGVTISLLQTDYPAGVEKLTFILDNASDLKVLCSDEFLAIKYVDGAWREIDFREDAVTLDEAYIVWPHSARAISINLNFLARPLDEGLYRITGENLRAGEERVESSSWHVDFRVTADAQPEPDYALCIPGQPIPTVEGCAVTDRIPVKFINNTGEGGNMLHIPHLEKRNEAGEWEEVPYREGIGFCGTPDPLPVEGQEWSEEISMLWGSLTDGEYRLSYEVGATFDTEDVAYGTFTLYTPENAGLPLAEE